MLQHPAYRRSPALLQDTLLDIRGLVERRVRTSGNYRRYLDEARASQWLAPGALADLGRRRLDAMLHAARGCPHYAGVFAEHGITGAGDFAKLPLLDRTAVRTLGDALLNRHYHGLRTRGSTSGTSGTALTLHKAIDEIRHEAACYQRQLDWAGHEPGDRLVWLRGDMVVDPARTSPPYWRHARLGRTLYMSSYHLGTGTAAAYIAELERHGPAIIQAYPSSVTFLARHLDREGRRFRSPLKAIVTSSEKLDGDARALIEHCFGTRVHDWYGSYERVAAIGTCEHGEYHLLTDYSHVELLPAGDGRLEIVGTTLHNTLMPLLRYRTGDHVVPGPSAPCACGRHFPRIATIAGRDDDCVITPSGRRIGRLDHVFKGMPAILEARIIQEDPARLTIEVVAASGYSAADEAALKDRASTLTGGELAIDVVRTARIERGARGKHRLVENRLPSTTD